MRPAISSAATGSIKANSTVALPRRPAIRALAVATGRANRLKRVGFMVQSPSTDPLFHEADLLHEGDADALIDAIVHAESGVAGKRHLVGDDQGALGSKAGITRPVHDIVRKIDRAVENGARAAVNGGGLAVLQHRVPGERFTEPLLLMCRLLLLHPLGAV